MKTEQPTLNTSKINELRDFLQIRQGKKCKDYFSRYPLGEEWVYSGKLFSEKIIYSDSGPAEMIRASHRANAFNLPNTRNDKRKELELQWWKEFFKREFKIDIETLHQDYQESEEIPEEEQIIYHGKRFSYNFFLKLAYLY